MQLSAQQLKHIQSLKVKKYRQNYAEFVIAGEKIVTEALLEKVPVQQIVALQSWIDTHSHSLPDDTEIITATEKQIERIASTQSPQPVIAVLRQMQHVLPEKPDPHTWYLALDGISDPGNFGTIVRTADWFGIHTILCSENCVDFYNPKTVQASMGSLFRVHAVYGHLPEIFKQISLPKYAADTNGKSIDQTEFGKSGILVIGSESHGISEEVKKMCEKTISIPGIGHAESLNAAIATGILLYRIRNQETGIRTF